MEKLQAELKALKEQETALGHEAYNVKVKQAFLRKRIKLVEAEIEATEKK